jgi:hypothetical protein
MAVLNYRDPGTGQWVAVPVLEGARGPAGPKGSPGVVAISADAGNAAVLGTDGQLFVPAGGLDSATANSLYVNVVGDAMTGELKVPDQVSVPPIDVRTAAAKGYVDQVVTVSDVDPSGVPVRDGLAWFVTAEAPPSAPPTSVSGVLVDATTNTISWVDSVDPSVTGYEVFYNTTGAPVTASNTLLGTVLPGVQTITHTKDAAAQAAGFVYYGIRAVNLGGASALAQATLEQTIRYEPTWGLDSGGAATLTLSYGCWPETFTYSWSGSILTIGIPAPLPLLPGGIYEDYPYVLGGYNWLGHTDHIYSPGDVFVPHPFGATYPDADGYYYSLGMDFVGTAATATVYAGWGDDHLPAGATDNIEDSVALGGGTSHVGTLGVFAPLLATGERFMPLATVPGSAIPPGFWMVNFLIMGTLLGSTLTIDTSHRFQYGTRSATAQVEAAPPRPVYDSGTKAFFAEAMTLNPTAYDQSKGDQIRALQAFITKTGALS